MQTTPTGGWREGSGETLWRYHCGEKIRKSQTLPSKKGKGESIGYVCMCVCALTKRRQQLLRYLILKKLQLEEKEVVWTFHL